MKYLSRAENTEIIRKLAAPQEAARDEAMKQINNLLMIKSFETGYARMYFENISENGMRIIDPDHELYTIVDDDKPGIMYHIQPEVDLDPTLGEKAVSMNPYGGVRNKRFSGTRFVESFDILSTPIYYQHINALYTYPYDIVEYFENRQTRLLLDLEDKLFFSLANSLMALNSSALSSLNIMPVDGDGFNMFHFSTFRDFHNRKQVPASRLLVHYSLFNEVERTTALNIEGVAKDGLMGKLTLDNGLFKMNPIILNTQKYCYYSFDIANMTDKAETEQFFIQLDDFTDGLKSDPAGYNWAGASDRATNRALIKAYMTALGYRYKGTSADEELAGSYSPAIPMDADEVLIGHKFYRSWILPQQQYFGHFDLFLKDAETVVEKHGKFIHFHTEEEMVMTAKNPYAVTAMDVWDL